VPGPGGRMGHHQYGDTQDHSQRKGRNQQSSWHRRAEPGGRRVGSRSGQLFLSVNWQMSV
jgi:hypothetical protein